MIDMVLSVPSPMYAPGLTGRRTAKSLLPERCAQVFAGVGVVGVIAMASTFGMGAPKTAEMRINSN